MFPRLQQVMSTCCVHPASREQLVWGRGASGRPPAPGCLILRPPASGPQEGAWGAAFTKGFQGPTQPGLPLLHLAAAPGDGSSCLQLTDRGEAWGQASFCPQTVCLPALPPAGVGLQPPWGENFRVHLPAWGPNPPPPASQPDQPRPQPLEPQEAREMDSYVSRWHL